jgi:hypothetical protein
MIRTFVTVFLLLLMVSNSWGTDTTSPDLTGISFFTKSGEPFAADQIGKEQSALLALIDKGDSGSMKLLDVIEHLQQQFPENRLFIVVPSADEKVLETISGKYPGIVAGWYRDPEDTLAKRLKFAVTPIVMGVRDARVAWNILGVAEPKQLEKTMRGWLNR